MSLTSFVVSRNWASSRLRLLLTLAGIALGVAIVVAIYVMDHNTIQSRLLLQDPQRGRVDLEVVPTATTATTEQVRQRLERHAGVQRVATFCEARGTAVAGGRSLDLAVFGLGPLPAGPFGHYALTAQGRDLEPADDDLERPGILLGHEAATALGVRPGDRLRLRGPELLPRVECRDGKLVTLPLPAGAAPFAAEVQVVGILSGERLGGRNQGHVAVAGLELARRLGTRGSDVFHVLRRPGADLDQLSRDLREEFHVQDMRGALIGEGADERAFRNGLKVLGGLALLLGMYVVFQTLSHSLVARVRQLGLLRCLGAGTGAITRIFLCDALLLGLAGSALGVLLGLLLAMALRAHEVSSLGLGKPWTTFEIPLFPVGWTFALGVLFTLAGAMFPLVRARQVPALDILRARGLAPGKDDGVDLLRGINLWMFGLLVLALPFAYLAMTPLAAEEGRETLVVLLELVGLLGLFGSVLLLAPAAVGWLGRALLWPLRWPLPLASWLVGKVVVRSAGRVAAAVCGLSAVLLALLGLKSLTGSLRAEVETFAAVALQGRVFLVTASARPEVGEQLAALPGVVQADCFHGERRGDGYFLRGLSAASAGGRGGALEGYDDLVRRYADPQVRTVVVSRRLALNQGLREGSTLSIRNDQGAPVAYQVLRVSDASGFDGDERAFAITAPHWMRVDFCLPEKCVQRVTLHLAAGAEPPAVLAGARAALGDVAKAKTGDGDIRGYLLRDVDRDFVLFDLLLFLMLVLAGVGLLNGMTIAAIGRARELGVLRALGMSRRQLGGSFLLEGALVAALASLLSLGLAWPMSWVLVEGMNRVASLEAPLTPPYPWFWLVPAAALATCVLAAVVPAWRSLRQSPSESVRYE
ncbi:MAG: ABC transporter permease [Planctomycetes bacterium]|nr:ABC transporter permease [Planctomycetota bacterium]